MNQQFALSALLLPVAAHICPAYSVDYLTVSEAQRALFPNASSFADQTLHFSKAQRQAIKQRAGTRQRGASQRVWRAEHAGERLGWLLVDEVIGKHEFITYALALSPQGDVLGVEIMSYRESHGSQIRNADWRGEFTGKTAEDTLQLGKDIRNISGATLSCRNITDGIRRLLVQWDLFLRHT